MVIWFGNSVHFLVVPHGLCFPRSAVANTGGCGFVTSNCCVGATEKPWYDSGHRLQLFKFDRVLLGPGRFTSPSQLASVFVYRRLSASNHTICEIMSPPQYSVLSFSLNRRYLSKAYIHHLSQDLCMCNFCSLYQVSCEDSGRLGRQVSKADNPLNLGFRIGTSSSLQHWIDNTGVGRSVIRRLSQHICCTNKSLLLKYLRIIRTATSVVHIFQDLWDFSKCLP